MSTPPSSEPPVPRLREQVIGDGIAWTARWSLRWLLIALGAGLLGWVVSQFWSILLPVVFALVVTTVLQPPARFLERRVHLPAGLSAAAVLLSAFGLLVLTGVLIAPTVGSQVGDIARDASTGLTRVQGWLNNSSLITNQQIDTVVTAVQGRLTSSASTIASGVLVGVSAVTSAVITLLITLVLTFFFLKDGRRFLPWVGSLSGTRVGPHLVGVSSRAWAALGGFIRTQALVSLIDAVLIGAGLLIVGVPLALPLAILTFFGGFIPIVGAISVGAISVLVALVSNGVTGAVIIFVLILAVQQLEGNVLTPLLQSRTTNLHAAVVLLGIALGSTLFGIIGAFLAVPVLAVAAVVLRYLNEVVAAKAVEEAGTGETLDGPVAATVEGTPEQLAEAGVPLEGEDDPGAADDAPTPAGAE
ncbi:MAG: AI-2E family transporter, partial [Nocardioidaceae bacterium]